MSGHRWKVVLLVEAENLLDVSSGCHIMDSEICVWEGGRWAMED